MPDRDDAPRAATPPPTADGIVRRLSRAARDSRHLTLSPDEAACLADGWDRLNATVGAAELEREAAVSALSREVAALRAERDKLRAAAAVALDVLGAEQLTPENRHDPKTLRSLEAVLYLTDALGLPAEPPGHAGLD